MSLPMFHLDSFGIKVTSDVKKLSPEDSEVVNRYLNAVWETWIYTNKYDMPNC